MTKLKEKAEELEKFLQDRLSEDDYKTVGRLLKEILLLSLEPVKDVFEEYEKAD